MTTISERLLETASKLEEQGVSGPFLFRMPVALAKQLLAELEVTDVPKGSTFEWNGHTILAEDNITVHKLPDSDEGGGGIGQGGL